MRPWLLLLVLGLSLPASARRALDPGESFATHPDYTAFVQSVARNLQADPGELDRLFRQVQLKPQILRIISLPPETRPWDQYRPLFVNEQRIQGGVRFWQQHSATLARAQQRYGVPPALVTAVIGVETLYGRNTGGYRVLDALTTLAVAYPPRADFFRRELEQFLLLAREQDVDALAVKGSYAGAMGMGQFMPSSWRSYGIDFDGDGHADPWRNPADAIGSVAHYLSAFGWQADAPVAVRVDVPREDTRERANTGWATRWPVAAWRELGVAVPAGVPDESEAMLVRLDTAAGPEFWLAFQNYYVITRYNRSFQYALAVYQLAQEIAAAHDAGCAGC